MTWQDRILAYLKRGRCYDCGRFWMPCQLDFDHRVPKQKPLNWKATLRKSSPESFAEAIEKLDVVCSNCHRRRTQIQFKEGMIDTSRFGRPKADADWQTAKKLIEAGVSFVKTGKVLGVSRLTVKRALQENRV